MRKDNEHIEEKLIPYLEGVLNPKEAREVEEAINSDRELAREMSELRELIVELRQGFASGLRPPQEDVTVDEVVELGANTGSVDSLPGSSQQKARLFCSDQALEEYSLLRALGEEMSRTTLDRDNIPEMPESLLKEFRALKPAAGAKGKVLPFDRKKLSPVPLWRRASGMLDRIDPKPLMASAAALVLLSLGVHMYRTPADSAAPVSGSAAEIGYNFDGEKGTAGDQQAPTPSASASPALPADLAKDGGVAVFTSDDRGLLKQQAEKLMAGKVRYTVTKDRILVAEKDMEEARSILWGDAEGKAVAMANEVTASKRMAQPASEASAAGGASPVPARDEAPAYYPGNSGGGQAAPDNAPVVDAERELEAQSEPGTVTYYPPSPQHAPPKPSPAKPRAVPSYASPPKREAAAESYDIGANRRSSNNTYDSTDAPGALKPKAPAPATAEVSPPVKARPRVQASIEYSATESNASGAPPEPTVVDTVARTKASEAPKPMTEERRAKLQKLALGEDGATSSVDRKDSDDGLSIKENEGSRRVPAPPVAPTVSVPPPPPAPITATGQQAQRTETMNRGRVAAAPPSAPATGPVPNVISAGVPADAAGGEESLNAKADARLAKMESSRQAVAQRNGVELSFESKNGKVSVYVRPKKTLNKAEMDALRKTLRKELGLADSDTIIIR